MTFAFHKGRYGVRLAQTEADVTACQSLRHQCFFGAPGLDQDGFDEGAQHLMIAGDAGLVATCRLRQFNDGLNRSYAAERYDISALNTFGPALEIGRFCILPEALDPDTLRLAWGALTRIVDDQGIKLLFGCPSFDGIDPQKHAAALGYLGRKAQGPKKLPIGKINHDVVKLDEFTEETGHALAQMPPLLRTYLAMGGWVSDHAVIDREMQTLHVFCAVEVAKIPPARARALRAIAG